MTAAVDYGVILERSRRDPAFFFTDVLGSDPWPRQVEIAESVRDNEETDVPSCHSSGKSWVAARIVLWFLFSHPNSKVILTAPTSRQVKGILWSELSGAYSGATIALGGEMHSLELKLADDWFVIGFTAADWDPNRFQGWHAPYILVVEDEAAGITRPIDDQIASLAAGGHGRILRIGNPVERDSPFHDSCEAGLSNVLPISAFDTPNFTEYGITLEDIKSGKWKAKVRHPLPVDDLINPKWVAGRLVAWGEDSDQWKARVMGQFPDVSMGSYYGKWLKKADEDERIGEYPVSETHLVHTAWDIGFRDQTAIWFFQIIGGSVRLVDYFEDSGETLPYYAGVLRDKGYGYGTHLAPHDIEVHEWTAAEAETRAEAARRLGINFVTVPRVREKRDHIEAARNLLPRCTFNKATTKGGRKALANFKKAQNSRTGEWQDHPEKNDDMHCADAFHTLAMGHGLVATSGVGLTRPERPRTMGVT